MTDARWYHTTVRLANGAVLVAGGYGSDDPENGIFGGALNSSELYDPNTWTWNAAGTLAVARYDHRAVVLQDGRVLVVGGIDVDGYGTSTAEIYNPATNTWSPAASMSTDRYGHQLTVLSDGRVLASGGLNGGAPTNTAEIYDPQQDEWQSAGTMRSARVLAEAVRLTDGKVLVAGGINTSGFLSSAEIFDPSTGTWSAAASMAANRNRFGMAVLTCPSAVPNCNWAGKVLVAGGTDTEPGAEIFDPASGTWRSTSAMSTSRRYHSATIPLADGRVMVAGGDNGNQGHLDGAEIFDAALGLWSPVNVMNMSRSLAGGVELLDGRILIAGGFGQDIFGEVGVTNTAEAYLPCPPNLPPVAVCASRVIYTGPNATTCGAPAPDVNDGSYDPDNGPGLLTLWQSPAVDSTLSVGVTTVTHTADDGMYQSTCSATVTVVDDTPPLLVCPTDPEPVECQHLGNTASEGHGSQIFENVVGTFDNCSLTVTCTRSGERLPMGDHPVTCAATDAAQNSTSCSFVASVVDTTPPVTGPSNNMVLWPADSTYHEVSLMDCAGHTQDSCSGRLNLRAHGVITKISSDEYEDFPGNSDGNTLVDMQIKKPWLALLRAERRGSLDGRVYTVHYRVTDPSGNSADSSCKVYVPVQSGTPVVEGPPLYCVGPNC